MQPFSRESRGLFRYLRRYRGRYAFGVLALAICDAGNLTIPWITGKFADAFKSGGLTVAGILPYAGAIVSVAVAVAVFRFVWRIFVFGTARAVEYDLREAFFAHLQRLPASFFNTHKTGDLMAHATNDLQAVRAAAGDGVLMAADSALMSVFTLLLMLLTVDWRLTLLGLLPLPLLAVNATVFGRLIHDRFSSVQAAFSTLSDRTQENIAGIRVVKAFAQEGREVERFRRDNRAYVNAFMRLARIRGVLDPSIQFLAGLGFVLVLGYGGRLVLLGRITLGEFVAFNSYLLMMAWPMLAIGWVVNLLQRGVASMGRIQAILDTVPEVADGPDLAPPARRAAPATPPGSRIEFRRLSFSYEPDLPPALQDIDAVVEPGPTLGVIGRIGSGKTTLANLLVRLHNPPGGTLYVDGTDVNRIPLAELRGMFGYVPQDSFLFSRSIADNIAFSPGSHSPQSVAAAVAVAQLEDDLRDFPAGCETLVGERGVTLSGGQRQRVGIARALVKDPQVLILDDCLSAVDTATEARILAGLRPLMQGRTTILISHRVSAVKYADEIVVLDAGRIKERGTHDQLLAARGAYWRLYERQQLEEDIERDE